MFYLDPEGAKIGGNCLSHTEVDLTDPMIDIVGSIYRRIMMILHPTPKTSNRLCVSCSLIGRYKSLRVSIGTLL